MNGQAIIDKIISDAEQEAREIISDAERKAEATVAEAVQRAERNRQGVRAEVAEKVQSIFDGKSATARLDCAKIQLGEKRGVIDEIYARALKRLNELSEGEALYFAGRLLDAYAEEGDEIVFASNFRYAQKVAELDAVKQKGLKVSLKHSTIDGGFLLVGKTSDKNLSYGAILSADREQHQAEISAKLF